MKKSRFLATRRGLAVTLYEPPQLSRDPEPARAAFYRTIPKFLLFEARHTDPPRIGAPASS